MADASVDKPLWGCRHCHMHHACPMADEEGPQNIDLGPDSQGAPFVVSTILVFLMPLAAGIAGAALAGHAGGVSTGESVSGHQALGLLAGLAVGVAAAKGFVALRLRRRRPTCSVGED